MDRAARGRSDGSRWKCVPRTGGVVTRPRNGVLRVRRVSNRLDRVGIPLERLAGCSTSLSIPGSNGVVVGSGDDVAPIGRVSNRRQQLKMALERETVGVARLGIPDSKRVIA